MTQESLLHHVFNLILVESRADRRQGATFESPLEMDVMREAFPHLQIDQLEHKLSPGARSHVTTYIARDSVALGAIERGGRVSGIFLGYLVPRDVRNRGTPPAEYGWVITWNATWWPWFGHSHSRQVGEQSFKLYDEGAGKGFDLNALAERRRELEGRFAAAGFAVSIGFTVNALNLGV